MCTYGVQQWLHPDATHWIDHFSTTEIRKMITFVLLALSLRISNELYWGALIINSVLIDFVPNFNAQNFSPEPH